MSDYKWIVDSYIMSLLALPDILHIQIMFVLLVLKDHELGLSWIRHEKYFYDWLRHHARELDSHGEWARNAERLTLG